MAVSLRLTVKLPKNSGGYASFGPRRSLRKNKTPPARKAGGFPPCAAPKARHPPLPQVLTTHCFCLLFFAHGLGVAAALALSLRSFSFLSATRSFIST